FLLRDSLGPVIRQVIDRAPLLVLELELKLTLLGDLERGVARACETRESLAHQRRRLQIELVRNEALRTIEVEIPTVLDALEHLVRLGELWVEIVSLRRR